MNELSLGFYCAAALSDLAAAVVATLDVKDRISRLKELDMPTRTSLTLLWNSQPDVVQRITDLLGPEGMERRRREADNEARTAVAHIGRVAGVDASPSRLLLVLLLLSSARSWAPAGTSQALYSWPAAKLTVQRTWPRSSETLPS